MKPKLIVILVLALLLLIILIQNTQVTTLNILFWSISMSQIILMLIILLGGFAIGYLTRMVTSRRR